MTTALYRIVTHFEDGSTGDLWNLTNDELMHVIRASLSAETDRRAVGFEVTASFDA